MNNIRNNDYREYLAHYGVVGMRWGVRRYQPYSVHPRKNGATGKEFGSARSKSKKSYTGGPAEAISVSAKLVTIATTTKLLATIAESVSKILRNVGLKKDGPKPKKVPRSTSKRLAKEALSKIKNKPISEIDVNDLNRYANTINRVREIESNSVGSRQD